MENQSPAPPEIERTAPGEISGQPGSQAMEALIRAIAQEFVVAFDEFNDAVLTDDDSDDAPKVHTVGK